jgi:YHS domain-containing protein
MMLVRDTRERSDEMAIDPVCGMEVDPQTAEYRSEYKGKTYFFCSFSCKQQFEQEPEAYSNPDYTPPEKKG